MIFNFSDDNFKKLLFFNIFFNFMYSIAHDRN